MVGIPTSAFAYPQGTTWQWQLTGNIDLTYDVDVYDIDLFDASTSEIAQLKNKGVSVICYFSAGSFEDWRPDAGDFPKSVKGNNNGWPGEKWLDISNLAVLQPIMEKRLDLCVEKGFDAVEPDNIDGFDNNSGFNLNANDQLVYNKMLAREAHERGLLIGLKNDAGQATQLEPFFDFVIMEECKKFSECGDYAAFTDNGKAGFMAEYSGKLNGICKEADKFGFSAIKKRLDLDDWVRFCEPITTTPPPDPDPIPDPDPDPIPDPDPTPASIIITSHSETVKGKKGVLTFKSDVQASVDGQPTGLQYTYIYGNGELILETIKKAELKINKAKSNIKNIAEIDESKNTINFDLSSFSFNDDDTVQIKLELIFENASAETQYSFTVYFDPEKPDIHGG